MKNNAIKRTAQALMALSLMAACVPTSKYQQAQQATRDKQNKIEAQAVQMDQLKKRIAQLEKDLKEAQADKDRLAQDTALAGVRNRTLQNRLAVLDNDLQMLASKMGDAPEYRSLMQHLMQMQDELATSEDKLLDKTKDIEAQKRKLADANNALAESERQLQQSNDELANKSRTIASQQSEIDIKNQTIVSQQDALDKARGDIERQAAQLREMEAALRAKDSAMVALRNRIASALTDFNSDELTVNHRDGKVYVSLEEKLLFASGKYDVNEKGVGALKKIATVLKNVGDQMTIMVEGHTDNVPLHGQVIEDNWDLSVKRATSVLRVLVAGGVDRKQVQATGRADTAPVASNNTDDGRRKNRRTEIILAPKIDQILSTIGG